MADVRLDDYSHASVKETILDDRHPAPPSCNTRGHSGASVFDGPSSAQDIIEFADHFITNNTPIPLAFLDYVWLFLQGLTSLEDAINIHNPTRTTNPENPQILILARQKVRRLLFLENCNRKNISHHNCHIRAQV